MGAGVFRYVVAQGMAYWMLNEEFYASQVVDFVTYVLLDALMIAFCMWLAGRQNKRAAVEGGLLTALPIESLRDLCNPMTRLVVMLLILNAMQPIETKETK